MFNLKMTSMCNICKGKNDQPTQDCGCSKTSEIRNIIGYLHTKVLEKVGQFEGFPNIEPQTHYALVANETRRLLTRAGYTGLKIHPGLSTADITIHNHYSGLEIREFNRMKSEGLPLWIAPSATRGTQSIQTYLMGNVFR